MGLAAPDILAVEALIKADGRMKILHQLIGCLFGNGLPRAFS
jgi:hypothetical protein